MRRNDVINYASSLSGEAGHTEVLRIYNGQKTLPRGYAVRLNDPWCATFVSACFLKYGYSDISECSCDQMIKKAKALGIWVEDDKYNAKPGDVLLYDWSDSSNNYATTDNTGSADHVGIITFADNNSYKIIEGNKNKAIGTRVIAKNGRFIRGFITPPYEAEASSNKDKVIERIEGVDIDTLYKLKGAQGVKDEMIRIVKEGV